MLRRFVGIEKGTSQIYEKKGVKAMVKRNKIEINRLNINESQYKLPLYLSLNGKYSHFF